MVYNLSKKFRKKIHPLNIWTLFLIQLFPYSFVFAMDGELKEFPKEKQENKKFEQLLELNGKHWHLHQKQPIAERVRESDIYHIHEILHQQKSIDELEDTLKDMRQFHELLHQKEEKIYKNIRNHYH